MSANLGALLKQLDANLRIELYEVTRELSQESSNGWNNAGTGHAGICEVAYTPDRGEDGEIKVGHKGNGRVKGSTLITLSEGKVLCIEAFEDAKFLVISGRPINEEIARGGPFVMNTREEVIEAIEDYRNGTFIK